MILVHVHVYIHIHTYTCIHKYLDAQRGEGGGGQGLGGPEDVRGHFWCSCVCVLVFLKGERVEWCWS